MGDWGPQLLAQASRRVPELGHLHQKDAPHDDQYAVLTAVVNHGDMHDSTRAAR